MCILGSRLCRMSCSSGEKQTGSPSILTQHASGSRQHTLERTPRHASRYHMDDMRDGLRVRKRNLGSPWAEFGVGANQVKLADAE